MTTFLVRVLLLAVALTGAGLRDLGAHEIRPAYLQIDEIDGGRYQVVWRTPVLSGMPLPVLLAYSNGITMLSEPVRQRLSDSIVDRSIVVAPGGLEGQRVSFVGLQATITDVVVRLELKDGTTSTTIIRPSQPWIDFSGATSTLEVAGMFLEQGIEHILMGLDHLLFIAALMLVVGNWSTLVKTVTAFTVAHSITLTGVTLGWMSLPSGPVEILIALSIVLMCAEVVGGERGRESLACSAPWIVAFAFGLLHGFGFAGALQELGLPPGDLPLALLCFNLGVEIGQLMFVAAVLLTCSALRHLLPLPRRAILLPTYSIGIVAAFWTIERVHATFT